MSMAVAYECPTTNDRATMEDAGLGDSSAALVLEVAEGDHRQTPPSRYKPGGGKHALPTGRV